MPISDMLLVFQWWGTLFLVGAAVYPLTKYLFRDWFDRGFLFTKAVGFSVITFGVYLLGILHIAPFTQATVWYVMGAIFLLGIPLYLRKKDDHTWRRPLLVAGEELFFFAALLFWTWVKAHEPSIHNLEKYMDFGFTKSIFDSRYFPAPDMWYAGFSINYYYFGHTVMAVLTKLSGIDLTYTFNLMLATIFALCFTMSFSIGVQLLRIKKGIGLLGQIGGGILTAFLVTLAGNMQTIYAFTKGYSGDAVKPFWTLAWSLKDIGGFAGIWNGTLWGKLGEGMNIYWYANATRFIPYTIHEFPSYSYVVSDVHGHVLSIPFVLLAIGLLISMFAFKTEKQAKSDRAEWVRYGFYGFLAAVLLMTNALDGPIYFVLLVAILILSNIQSQIFNWKTVGIKIGITLSATILVSLPFLLHFNSFVNGLAVNCPPAAFANTKIGPILFEGVEKCQHSPFWMWWLLWGFFVYCGAWLMVSMSQRINVFAQDKRKYVWAWLKSAEPHELVLATFFIISVLLLIFPEFFYFKDIYPMHFRSNTMFKLGYQAFIMCSIVAGYTIATLCRRIHLSKSARTVFFILLIPQLFLISIYPLFSVRSYFDGLKHYEGIFGMGWFQRQYPDDWAGIEWLNTNAAMRQRGNAAAPVIVEADGDSYTDYNAFSAFTGLPTIEGWAVHEWLWRGSYDVVAPRRAEVGEIYESTDIGRTKQILQKYHVKYVIVGTFEREKYKNLQETKFRDLGKSVFSHGETTIYQID